MHQDTAHKQDHIGPEFRRISGCNEFWWNTLFKKTTRSFIFADQRMLELFHWTGGLSKLLESNVTGIRSIEEDDCEVPDICKKVTFIVNDILQGNSPTLHKIEDILKANAFEYCIIVTVPSHYIYTVAKNGWDEDIALTQIRGTPTFDTLEQQVIEWMGNANFTVEVFSLPLFLSSPINCSFLFCPGFSKLMPQLSDSFFHTEWSNLGYSMKKEIQLFVGCWHNLLTSLDAKEDCYCIGPLSSQIATRLANFNPAKNRRKTAKNHVSLIFVDRSVDLLEPLKCPTAPILDRILFSLPNMTGHGSDRKVTLGSHCEFPGVVFHSKDATGANQLFEACLLDSIQSSAKTAVELLGKELQEREVQIPRSGGSILDSLGDMIEMLRNDEDLAADFAPLYEAASALHSVSSELPGEKLKHARRAKFVKRARHSQFTVEKLLQMGDTENMSLEEYLLCLIAMVSTHPLNWTENTSESLIGHFSDKLLVEGQNAPHYLRLPNGEHDELTARESIKVIFQILRNYKRLRTVLELGKSGNYLSSLLEQLLDPSDPETPDVVCKTSGIGNVLRSGLGLFTNVMGRPSRPTDAKAIVLFILGGISCGEVADLCKIIEKDIRPGTEVILGSNRIISAKDVLEAVLGLYN